jgi:hypothetical protein
MLQALSITALLASGGAIWLARAWSRALSLHDEVLELQCELPMPQGSPWPAEVRFSTEDRFSEELANLAAAMQGAGTGTRPSHESGPVPAVIVRGGALQTARSPQ